MGLDVLEKKQKEHRVGEVIKGWRLLETNSKSNKAIIECEKCGLTKEANLSGYYHATIASCLCNGLALFNNEPVVYTTEGQKQVIDMLNMGDSYGDVGERLGVSRQSVGNTVKSVRTNYLKYLKQLEKSNEIKANRE